MIAQQTIAPEVRGESMLARCGSIIRMPPSQINDAQKDLETILRNDL